MLKKFTKEEREDLKNKYHSEPLFIAAETVCSFFDNRLQAYVLWPEDYFNEAAVIIDDIKQNGDEFIPEISKLWKNTYPRFREYDKTVPDNEIKLATTIVLSIVALILNLSDDTTHQSMARLIMDTVRNHFTEEWEKTFAELGNECNRFSKPLRKWINDYMQLNNTQYISDDIEELFAPAPKIKKSPKKEILFTIENMTFALGSALNGHIVLLYHAMRKSNWIDKDTKPDDFTNLFCGKTCQCRIKVGDIGTDNIYALFNAMIDNGFIKLPEGYGMESIVRSHFSKKDGSYIAKNRSKPSKKSASKITEFCLIMDIQTDNYD